MTSTDAQKRAAGGYRKCSVRQLNVALNATTDRDIIEWLDGLAEGRAAYVRRLIREDIRQSARG